jgi:hypothetical protein
MSPSAAPTVSHVDIQRSRQLVHDSRVLIATAKELIAQSRQSIARQRYFKIVCAWCQQTIRWQRTEGAAPGQISHSICFDCFAPMFLELAPGTTPPLFPRRGHSLPAPVSSRLDPLPRARGLYEPCG